MTKTIRWLGVLLGIQLLMALGLNFSGLWLAEQPGASPLVEVPQDQIDRIVLEGPDHAKVALVKQEGAWHLPDVGKFPADSNRVNTMLEKLTGMKTGAPIATTPGAKVRFKVGDEAFERRITLAQGDKTLATLYLGASPGLRRSHARADGEDAIYVLELAAYEVPVETADWEDKTILQLPKKDIASMEVAGLRFEQTTKATSPKPVEQTEDLTEAASPPSVWEAKGLEAPWRLKPEAVDKLAGLLAGLTFDKVLGRDAKTEYGLEKPLLTLTVTREKGDTLIYRLGKSPNEEMYTLKVSNRPEYFRLPAYKATPLLEVAERKQLLMTVVESRGQTNS